MTTLDHLASLEDNIIRAVHTLEGERFYDHSAGLIETVRVLKHYQRIAETMLAAQTGLPALLNRTEAERAYARNDWYRFPDRPVAGTTENSTD